ncbi:MAG: hypothetical protein KDC92_06175 [Bacteroidetes bacterium]|nr:hypothetical protein [Bacteroidota bacterium]
MRTTLLTLLIIQLFYHKSKACTPVSISNDISLTPANLTSSISYGTPNSNEIQIDVSIVINNGRTLSVKGTPNNRLTLFMKPGQSITVKKGGTLIMEYCDIQSGGTCTGLNITTWGGITVEGDNSAQHYDSYDYSGGYDPYAEPFKPWGVYNNSHGRLQMTW